MREHTQGQLNRRTVFTHTSTSGVDFTVRVVCECKLDSKERTILDNAVRDFANKIGSKRFKNWVLNFSYQYKTYTGALWWRRYTTHTVNNFKFSKGLTRQQIYQKIITGSEVLQPQANRQADITLVIDNRNKRGVLGYTYPNSVKQWIYRWFLNTTYKSVSMNLRHEWMHKLGFDHRWRYNPTRKYTVPYAVGYFE